MFITKKHIPRRTFLRGIGTTLALPLLQRSVLWASGILMAPHPATGVPCRTAQTSIFRLSRNRWSLTGIAPSSSADSI